MSKLSDSLKAKIAAIMRTLNPRERAIIVTRYIDEAADEINRQFRCPLCGSNCFGTRMSDWTVCCHSSDDPKSTKRGSCPYMAKYDDPRHWVKK